MNLWLRSQVYESASNFVAFKLRMLRRRENAQPEEISKRLRTFRLRDQQERVVSCNKYFKVTLFFYATLQFAFQFKTISSSASSQPETCREECLSINYRGMCFLKWATIFASEKNFVAGINDKLQQMWLQRLILWFSSWSQCGMNT